MNEQVTSKGVLVVYLNVGMLPPYKAELFIERAKDQFTKSMETAKCAPLPNDVSFVFLPVRPPQETKVDYLPLDVASKEALERLNAVRQQLTDFLNMNTVKQLCCEEQTCSGEDCCCDDHCCCEEEPKKSWLDTVKGWFGCGK